MKDTNGDGVREYGGKPLAYEFLVPDDTVNQAELIKLIPGEFRCTIACGVEWEIYWAQRASRPLL